MVRVARRYAAIFDSSLSVKPEKAGITTPGARYANHSTVDGYPDYSPPVESGPADGRMADGSRAYHNVVGDPYPSRSASRPASAELSCRSAAGPNRAMALRDPFGLVSRFNRASGDVGAEEAAGCDRRR